MQNELKPCLWCHDHKGKTRLHFSVLDDYFCQYVHISMIKYCPFCGRKLEQE